MTFLYTFVLMESLLHYVWQHRMFNMDGLKTTGGLCVDVLYCGEHNVNQGPDFLNAKILLDGIVWVGNVELHTRSSDWNRHGHNMDPVYNTTILHVVEKADVDVFMQNGMAVWQLEIVIPEGLGNRFGELIKSNDYPRCHRFVSSIPSVKVNSWLDSLLVERLLNKNRRVASVLGQTGDNWSHTAFVLMARTLGFGLNGDPMELWAIHLPYEELYRKLGRISYLHLEKLFLDMAALDDAEKKGAWRYMRIRPGNYPEVRIKQLASVFFNCQCGADEILRCEDLIQLTEVFLVAGFSKAVSRLLVINAACPLIFSYGIVYGLEEYRNRALCVLFELRGEDNYILKQWRACGLEVSTAADSQALMQLKHEYCEHFRCLECRFGFEFMSQK